MKRQVFNSVSHPTFWQKIFYIKSRIVSVTTIDEEIHYDKELLSFYFRTKSKITEAYLFGWLIYSGISVVGQYKKLE